MTTVCHHQVRQSEPSLDECQQCVCVCVWDWCGDSGKIIDNVSRRSTLNLRLVGRDFVVVLERLESVSASRRARLHKLVFSCAVKNLQHAFSFVSIELLNIYLTFFSACERWLLVVACRGGVSESVFMRDFNGLS